MTVKYLSLVLFMFTLTACSDFRFHDALKSTREVYGEYVNVPATIDYEATGDIDDLQMTIAVNTQKLDLELTRLTRFMRNQDRPPTPNSVQNIFNNFDWINGVTVIDKEGKILVSQPEISLKKLDFAEIIGVTTKNVRDLKVVAQANDLGAEILIGVPIYTGTELHGYTIVHFDMRNLLPLVPNPENIAIFAPNTNLIDADNSFASMLDWAEVVENQSHDDDDDFTWVSRYLGELPIIYASSTATHKEEVEQEQMEKEQEALEEQEEAEIVEEAPVDETDEVVEEEITE